MHRFLLATFRKASEEFAEGKITEMDADEVEAGDVEIATDAALGEAVATTTGGEAATDLSMPAPVAAPGKARGPRDDRDFGGWVS
jgi:hypothetical protein